MDKKLLKYIIISICLIIVISIILVVAIIVIKDQNKKKLTEEINVKSSYEKNIVTNFSQLTDFNNIINNYYNDINLKNKTSIFNILSKEYLNKNNISEENILEHVEKIKDNQKYYATKIYEVQSNMSYRMYFIYGYIVNNETRQTGKKVEKNYIVCVDYATNTYELAPYGKLLNEYFDFQKDDIEVNENVDLSKISSTIYENQYNKVQHANIDEKYAAEFYLNLYIENAIYYPEDAYNSLDDEFKEKRFGNFEKYKDYMNDIKDVLEVSKLNKTKVIEREGYKEYICLDNYGKYYRFKEYGAMNYKVLLDTYTKELPELAENYKNANDEKKVALCVNTFFAMLNNHDYVSAYNKLDSGFKSNYFKTEKEFKKYVKEHFYDNNKSEVAKVKEVDGLYTIDVSYYNANTYVVSRFYTPEEKKKTFIVKLLDDNNFVMSFNVNE